MLGCINIGGILAACTKVCDDYERSAPTVSEWANGLYMRVNRSPDSVRLSELNLLDDLASGELGPNVAANAIYKLMCRLGQDTTGHAGF